MVPPCKHCNTKIFHHETKGFCYSDEEISLVTNDLCHISRRQLNSTDILEATITISLSHLSLLNMIKIYIKEIEGHIHFRYVVKYIISLTNYCLQTILHRIFNFISTIPSIKFKIVCACRSRLFHLFWPS